MMRSVLERSEETKKTKTKKQKNQRDTQTETQQRAAASHPVARGQK